MEENILSLIGDDFYDERLSAFAPYQSAEVSLSSDGQLTVKQGEEAKPFGIVLRPYSFHGSSLLVTVSGSKAPVSFFALSPTGKTLAKIGVKLTEDALAPVIVLPNIDPQAAAIGLVASPPQTSFTLKRLSLVHCALEYAATQGTLTISDVGLKLRLNAGRWRFDLMSNIEPGTTFVVDCADLWTFVLSAKSVERLNGIMLTVPCTADVKLSYCGSSTAASVALRPRFNA